ncbi:MAG: CDP-alcohol phosphatidyltransferase family protein [Candidatus Nomurabacteria bacterium]|jgi:CDP-diacylglycerol--glycerol-3-phosphate 3-phosphatidyltransferase|nr:CDP-alcohol phosphatidyltransferase family protein [Candidatus Nomurabacteria bacterium]
MIDLAVAFLLVGLSILGVIALLELIEKYRKTKPSKRPRCVKNLANTITKTRMALAFVAVAIWWWLPLSGAVLYALLAITDFLDGRAARRLKQVSNWGKLWDPRADKLLVWLGMVSFAAWALATTNWLAAAIVVLSLAITIVRDTDVMKLRAKASKKVDIAAKFTAKLKTALQMAAICLLFLVPACQTYLGAVWQTVLALAEVLLVIATLLAVISWADYRRIYRK